MAILLVAISGYSINVYCGYFINAYCGYFINAYCGYFINVYCDHSIGGYWCLFMTIILMAIGGFLVLNIGDYLCLLY